ncbi:universal stress protein [bacterium]|nr:universal stress protein [bacterium]
MNNSIQKILVAIAGGEASLGTAKYAISLAKWLNAELIAIYVVDMKALNDLLRVKLFVQIEEQEYEHDLESQGERYLKHTEKLAKAKGVTISTVEIKGIVHEEVTKKIKESDIDLLVMGELKEASSRRETFYDESERIFREAPCPVLVVKGDEEIDEMYDNL